MPDNDGVDDALRSATQTVAALLARRAQGKAIQREQRAKQRQFDLDRANARITAEYALDQVRGPQFMITHGVGTQAPRQQISKQEALDRINWTEQDRHQFDGRPIRGTQADISSWIGQDIEVDAAIAERYPQLMTDGQRAAVRDAEVAQDPNAFTLSTGDRDIAVTKQTALDVIAQSELHDFQQSSISTWAGRDRDIDRAIVKHHPNLMTSSRRAANEDSERRLAEAIETIRSAARTAEPKTEDLNKIRGLVGVDPEINREIYQHFPELLPAGSRRAQLTQQLYPAQPAFIAIHQTREGQCERTFSKQQALDRIENSATMLAPGGYFDKQHADRGVAAALDRDRFSTQRIDEFREWVGQDPEVDRLIEQAFPGAINDRQVAQLRVLEGKHHYPAEPTLVIRRDQTQPTKLTEPDAIGIIERRATTLGYLEAGPVRDELTNEISDMVGQTPAVDHAIERHFPELLDPAARANMTLAGAPEISQQETEPPDPTTVEKMRHAEALALYHSQTVRDDRNVQGLLDQLAALPSEVDDRSASRNGRPGRIIHPQTVDLQNELRSQIGSDLETDRIIHQHQPELLNAAQLARMRAADALLRADVEDRERGRHDNRGRDSEHAAEAEQKVAGTAHQARAQAEASADSQSEPDRFARQAASAEDRVGELESDADRDWDTAKQREARGRMYDSCGNAEAADARKLADTAQATPPKNALFKRITQRRPARRRRTPDARQRARSDRGR